MVAFRPLQEKNAPRLGFADRATVAATLERARARPPRTALAPRFRAARRRQSPAARPPPTRVATPRDGGGVATRHSGTAATPRHRAERLARRDHGARAATKV